MDCAEPDTSPIPPVSDASEVPVSVVRRALALVAAGQLRRAASSLLQKGIHEPTPEVEEQLRQLHLSSPVDALPPCPREAPSPSFSAAS